MQAAPAHPTGAEDEAEDGIRSRVRFRLRLVRTLGPAPLQSLFVVCSVYLCDQSPGCIGAGEGQAGTLAALVSSTQSARQTADSHRSEPLQSEFELHDCPSSLEDAGNTRAGRASSSPAQLPASHRSEPLQSEFELHDCPCVRDEGAKPPPGADPAGGAGRAPAIRPSGRKRAPNCCCKVAATRWYSLAQPRPRSALTSPLAYARKRWASLPKARHAMVA